MITVEHEYYIRFILLLLQVGTDLLREIIKKALKKRQENLHKFLNSSKNAILRDRKLTRIQKDTLYPSKIQGASIEDFDITLLSHLINNYLIQDIVQLEMDATNDIQQLRNKYQAHTTEAKMDPKTYTKEWNKLFRHIINVDTGMPSKVRKRHVDMIDSIEDDHIDIMALLKEIKKLDLSRVFFESIQHCLENVQTDVQDIKTTVHNTAGAIAGVDTNVSETKAEVMDTKAEVLGTKAMVTDTKAEVFDTKTAVLEINAEVMDTKAEVMDTKAEVMQMKDLLIELKQQRENQGRITKIVQTMYGKVYLSADDQETIDQAEADLLEASNNSIAKKEPTDMSHQALQEKVDLVVKDIENLDVKVEGVSKGSIIFEFKCHSLTAILDLIDYFYSSKFQRRLDDIAQTLKDITGKQVHITAVSIDKQSIKNVILKLQKKEHEKVVQFELSCTGVDGLLHILEVFEEGKATNSLNGLSKALSDSVGKPVTLHTSIDMNQMKNAIQAIKDQLATKDSQKSSARLTETQFASIVHKEDINLKNIKIPGCLAVLSSDRICVADNSNYTLTVINLRTKSVEAKTILDDCPFDIAVHNEQAAVTLPFDGRIMILRTTDMSTICSIKINGYPSGITYYQDELYVIYQTSFTWFLYVLVLNLEGEYLREFTLDNYSYFFQYLKCYIAISKPEHSLYITDWKNDGLIRYSLEGKRSAEYQHKELIEPRGLTTLHDGSLLVCCTNGTIHHISADLKQGYILSQIPNREISIAYDPNNQLVYINSCYRNIIPVTNIIQVFKFILKKEKHFDIITSTDQDPVQHGSHLRSASYNETKGAKVLGGMDHSSKLARHQSASYNQTSDTKFDIEFEPETKGAKVLGGMDHSSKLARHQSASYNETSDTKFDIEFEPETKGAKVLGGMDHSIKLARHQSAPYNERSDTKFDIEFEPETKSAKVHGGMVPSRCEQNPYRCKIL